MGDIGPVPNHSFHHFGQMGVVSYQNLSLKAFERQIMLALPIWLDRD
jgi:hypothetical protein